MRRGGIVVLVRVRVALALGALALGALALGALALGGCGAASAPPRPVDLDAALARWSRGERAARSTVRIDPRPLTEPVRIAHAPATDPFSARGRGAPIDVDFSRAPLTDALQLLADAARVNLVVGEGVDGHVSLTLRRIAPLAAMRALAEAHGVSLTYANGTVVASRNAP